MQTIDLYERITLRRSADLTLSLPGSFVPPNDKNTAYKAAVALSLIHICTVQLGDLRAHHLNLFRHIQKVPCTRAYQAAHGNIAFVSDLMLSLIHI